MRFVGAVALAAAIVLGDATVASASGLAYRTDHQAEVWLEHSLARWGGINLRAQDFRSAFCVNGYYSKHERRTGRQWPERTSSTGENLFHTFACTLSAGGQTWNLYLVARPLPTRGFSVQADR